MEAFMVFPRGVWMLVQCLWAASVLWYSQCMAAAPAQPPSLNQATAAAPGTPHHTRQSCVVTFKLILFYFVAFCVAACIDVEPRSC